MKPRNNAVDSKHIYTINRSGLQKKTSYRKCLVFFEERVHFQFTSASKCCLSWWLLPSSIIKYCLLYDKQLKVRKPLNFFLRLKASFFFKDVKTHLISQGTLTYIILFWSCSEIIIIAIISAMYRTYVVRIFFLEFISTVCHFMFWHCCHLWTIVVLNWCEEYF